MYLENVEDVYINVFIVTTIEYSLELSLNKVFATKKELT